MSLLSDTGETPQKSLHRLVPSGFLKHEHIREIIQLINIQAGVSKCNFSGGKPYST